MQLEVLVYVGIIPLFAKLPSFVLQIITIFQDNLGFGAYSLG